MSEKRYLLTHDEICRLQYIALSSLAWGDDDNDEMVELKQAKYRAMLESHEYRERTCQMSNEDWEDSFGEYKHLYECGICSESTALLCCINENGDTDWVKPKFCGYCGARVVSE